MIWTNNKKKEKGQKGRKKEERKKECATTVKMRHNSLLSLAAQIAKAFYLLSAINERKIICFDQTMSVIHIQTQSVV